MLTRDREYIHHIQSYCEDVADAIAELGNDRDVFLNNKHYISAISMYIFQISELCGGLSEDFKDAHRSEIPWALIRGMRNRFAHAYNKMDRIDIWKAATIDIPNLKVFCERFLA